MQLSKLFKKSEDKPIIHVQKEESKTFDYRGIEIPYKWEMPINDGMTSKFMYISPEISEHILETSEFLNRKINKSQKEEMVENMVSDMKNGYYVPSSGMICFDTNQDICNAHHTLSAIILSGKGYWFNCQFNTPELLINKMDQGIKRTLGHTLDMIDMKNVKYFSPLSKMIYNFYYTKEKNLGVPPANHNAVVKEYLDNQEEYLEALKAITPKWSHENCHFSFTVALFMRIVTSRIDKMKSAEFMSMLLGNSEHGDTFFHAQSLCRAITKTHKVQSNQKRDHCLQILFECWNNFINEDLSNNYQISDLDIKVKLPELKTKKD